MNYSRSPSGIHACVRRILLVFLLGLSGCAHEDRAVAPTALSPTPAPGLAATDSLRLTLFKLIRDGSPARAVDLLDEALARHPEDADLPILRDEIRARLSLRPLGLNSLEPSEQAAYSESRRNLLLAMREQDSALRTRAQRGFLTDTRKLGKNHPYFLELQVLRARTALAVEEPLAGIEAASRLMLLRIVEDAPPEHAALLADLRQAGWLDWADELHRAMPDLDRFSQAFMLDQKPEVIELVATRLAVWAHNPAVRARVVPNLMWMEVTDDPRLAAWRDDNNPVSPKLAPR